MSWTRICGLVLLVAAIATGVWSFVAGDGAAMTGGGDDRIDALARLLPARDTWTFVAVPDLARIYAEAHEAIVEIENGLTRETREEFRAYRLQELCRELFEVEIDAPSDLRRYGLGDGGAALAVLRGEDPVRIFRTSNPREFLRALEEAWSERRGRWPLDVTREVSEGIDVIQQVEIRVTEGGKGEEETSVTPRRMALHRDGVVFLTSGWFGDDLFEILTRGGPTLADDEDYRRQADRWPAGSDLVAFQRVPREEMDRDAALFLGGIVSAALSLSLVDDEVHGTLGVELGAGSFADLALRPVGAPALSELPGEDTLLAVEVAVDPDALFRRLRSSPARDAIDELDANLRIELELDLENDLLAAWSGRAGLLVRDRRVGSLSLDDRQRWIEVQAGESRFPWFASPVSRGESWPGMDLLETTVSLGIRDAETARRIVERGLEALVQHEDVRARVENREPRGPATWARTVRIEPPDEPVKIHLAIQGSDETLSAGLADACAEPVSGGDTADELAGPPDGGIVRIRADLPRLARFVSPAIEDEVVRAALRHAEKNFHPLTLCLDRVDRRLEGEFHFDRSVRSSFLAAPRPGSRTFVWTLVLTALLGGLGLTLWSKPS